MEGIIFFGNTLLSYGLLFVLMYLQLRYFSSRFNHTGIVLSLKRGFVLGIIALAMLAIIDISNIKNISDGRYVILFLSVMYYDVYTSVLPLIMINGFITLLYPANLISSLASTLWVVLLTYIYKRWVHKDGRNYIGVAAFSFLLGFTIFAIAYFIGQQTFYYETLMTNMLVSLLLFSGINALVMYLFDKESDHISMVHNMRLTRDELEMQNEEIRSLYENVSQKEQDLKTNYEVLDEYRWKLETSEKRYERVMRASCEGFFDYYPITKVWVISDRLCELLEYPIEESNLLSRNIFNLIPLEHKNIELYFEQGSIWPESHMIAFEIQIETKQGNLKWFLFSAIADIEENKIIRITGSLLDIHQRKLEQEKVAFYAFHDPLTGFLNRDFFVETVRKYLFSSNDNLMILNIGIAHYDSLVNVYGDKLLAIAQFQLGNDILERFDRFSVVSVLKPGLFGILILQKNMYFENVVTHIEELGRKYGTTQRFLNMDLELPLVFPYDEYKASDTAEAMLERLDITKSYCEEMQVYGVLAPFKWEYYNQKTFEKEISYYLKTAITESLFEVHYQPQCKIVEGESTVVGIEALVRLPHEQYGMVPPDVFIKLAEAIGEIHNIDKIVMSKVIAFARYLKSIEIEGLDISVNVSFIDLLNSDYIHWVITELTACKKEGIHIVLEITETAISKYFEGVQENLKKLTDAGINIHLDDFGTGYSSLSHLVKLPVDTLKIDRSFIIEITERKSMREIVRTIVNLGNELNLKVIAEGVETAEQLESLRAMSCEYYQGYYFSKPLAPDALVKFLKST